VGSTIAVDSVFTVVNGAKGAVVLVADVVKLRKSDFLAAVGLSLEATLGGVAVEIASVL